ncbi:hypothetical protein [Pseudoalteromonas luteoviolacea]|uniref:Uncharacterized protein n=1 Tax=Pseudoalteromonas luteoviolacea S4060-1 TaxID=1365257 RepID=A0A167KUZ3_9GAMM|nr:hypothetical protein [Pseudoalteromonas luteoviolacea]KZN63320.1 hypothetical protein N478_03460 [Pseudoalteromonas luteoviolacea S4060-1]
MNIQLTICDLEDQVYTNYQNVPIENIRDALMRRELDPSVGNFPNVNGKFRTVEITQVISTNREDNAGLDISEVIKQTNMSNRETMIIIVIPTIRMFHFTRKTLAGLRNEAWYPYKEGKLFEYVEKYLVDSGIANNVTRIEKKQSCGKSVDYVVTYNKAEHSVYKQTLNFSDAQLLTSFLITNGKSFQFEVISDDKFEININHAEKVDNYSFDEKLSAFKVFTVDELDEAVHEVSARVGEEVNNKGDLMQKCFLSLHGYTPDDIPELL